VSESSAAVHEAPWPTVPATAHDGPAGGPDYGRLADNLRHLLDVVAGARPPAALVTRAADRLASLSAELEPFTVSEFEQIAGHRPDLVGRGQTMVPAVIWDEQDSAHARCRTTFGRHFLGGGGAAHGGAIALLFDDVLSAVANIGRPPARTAYLRTTYRAIVPIAVELRLDVTVDRGEGRKWFVSGRLHHGDVLCAEAEALFVELRPGQR
jgi:acyl-coenzyme A thioesterase PaaI-like protein